VSRNRKVPTRTKQSATSGNDADDRVRQLAERLEDGYARIDQAALAGNDVTEWETFWIKLLREYEHVCSELDRAA
jgi:hypothetical protein